MESEVITPSVQSSLTTPMATDVNQLTTPVATDSIPDIRFSFKYLKLMPTRELNNKLDDTIQKNTSSFKRVDWISDSRSFNVSSLKNMKFDGKKITEKLRDNQCLDRMVKDVLKHVSAVVKLDDKLMSYVSAEPIANNELTDTDITPSDTFIDNISSNNLDTPTDQLYNNNTTAVDTSYVSNTSTQMFNSSNTSVGTVPNGMFESFEPIVDEMTTYSITPGRLLSYSNVCELVKNIARVKLTSHKKDESIKYAEERAKMKLREELNKYMKLSKISGELIPSFSVDIDEMNLKQLQTYAQEAKQLYEKEKITHIILQGVEGLDRVQSTVFKDGIKIPGTKKALKINNIGGALKEAIFDKRSPMYVAYENLSDKYNLRVSDEFLSGLTLLNTIIKNVEIVDAPKNDNAHDSSEDDSDDKSESNITTVARVPRVEVSNSSDDSSDDSSASMHESDSD